jgi:PHD/YefM family antitoxin component YafN of YafNO toxin-antitoxin module
MPQISLYIDEETLKKIEKAAKKEHISISKWVGNNIRRSFKSEYPENYFDLYGSVKDETMVAEDRAVYNPGVMESENSEDDVFIIKKGKNKGAVLISLEEYNSMMETLLILSSKKNADRLFESIEQMSSGQKVEKDPEDLK